MVVRSPSSFVGTLQRTVRPLGAVVALAVSLVLPAGVVGPQSARAQFTYNKRVSLSSPGSNPNLAWGDYDGDGTLDLVVLGQGASTVYDGNGSGGFSSTFSFNGFDNGAADWGDFDGDGDLDLVVTGFESGQGQVTKIYENTGGGNFSTVGAGIVGLSDGSASWGDYDKDGDPDLLVSGIDVNGANITRVYRNDGGGTFTHVLDGGEQGGPSAWGDFDGDGDLDFIVTGFYSPLSIVWQNLGDTDDDGDIEFGRVTNSIPGVQDGTVAWGDADADGAEELAILGNDGNLVSPIRVFDYDNGGFVQEDQVTGSEHGSIDWGDADNDGALDLLVTGYNGETSFSHVYTNDGDGTSFSFADDSFPAVRDGRAAFGDYDDDGILDAAITGNASSGNILEIWSADAVRSNRSPQSPSGLDGTVDGLANTLTLDWQGAADRSPNGTGGQATPASALTYNVFVRPQGSTDFVYPPEASTSSGERWVVRRGNVGSQTSLAIDPDALSEGTYEWSVQVLDYNYAGSSFPTGGTFTIARTDLGLSVSAADAAIPQGGQTTVALTLSNEGGSASAGGSTVTVDLPDGLSVTGSSGDGQFDGGVWTVNKSIASGSGATMDLTVQLDEKAEQTLNAGLTETETIDANDANHTAQTTIDVTEADLVLTSRGAEAEVGAQATPTFTLENTSSTTDATDVIVDVSVPSGLTVQGSTGDGSYSGGTWTVGTVASGQEATLDLTVQKDAASLQTLPAQLGGTGVVEPDGASTTSVVVPLPYGSEQALAFDGSGDYVNAGSDIRLDNRSFTISFWARRASSGSDHYVVGQGPTAAGNQSLHVGFRSDGRFTFAFFGDDLNTDAIYTGDGWHHWAVTFDASTNARRVYRDGAEVASDVAGAAFQGTGDFFIGQRALSGGGRRFDGSVDQLRVWHAALTQEQVQARMNRTVDLSSATAGDLVAAYRFDVGSGSTAYDVARGRHGTLQGDPQWTDPSEASAGRESAVVTDGSSSATVGPSGSSVEAALASGTGLANDATVYRWGSENGAVVTGEGFPGGVDDRANVVWGVWARGSAETELTLRYGNVSGLPGGEFVRLLRRDRPGTPWTDVTDASNVGHDPGSDQFTVTGVSDAAQYAVTTIPEVDLQLVDLPTKEVAQGEQTTLTLTLEHTSGSHDATNVTVGVAVPSGLSVQGSSGDGTYDSSSGTWGVGTVGAGATATLDLTVQKTAAAPQTLSAQLSALDQIDPDGASASRIVAPPPYGSGQALAFDGSGDYVNAGSGVRLDNRSFTISFWVRRASSGSYHNVVGQGTKEPHKSLNVAFTNEDEFVVAFINDNLFTGPNYPGGGWHHWAVTYDNDTQARVIYRDGVQVASDNAAAAYQGTGDFFIGQSALDGGSDRFDGEIDQLRVWHAALTQEQVQARMNRTIDLSSSLADALVASYRFDTGTGTTAYDVAGGHDGTFQGDPQWTDPSEASAGRESAVLTDSNTPVTVGPSGSRASATLTGGTGLPNDATVYRWGTEGGGVVTDETFPEGVDERSNVAWGVWPRGSAEAELTLSYGDVSGLPSGELVRLLRRDRPGTGWTDVSGTSNVSHDTGADQFTVTGVSSAAQYAVSTLSAVNLTLATDAQSLEVSQGGQTTVTLILENTSGSTSATGTIVDVAVPSGLSVQGSSGDGSYAGGTWDVGTVGAGATATLDLTVQKDAAPPQTLSAQLGGGNPDDASTSVVVAPWPYGSAQALTFDGSGDYVATGAGGDDLGLVNESFSVDVWFNPSSLPGSGDYALIGQDASATNEALHLALEPGGEVVFGFFGNDLRTTGGPIQTGAWQHLTFVYDATKADGQPDRFLYLNGEQIAADESSADFQGSSDLRIGRWDGFNNFDGRIDQVRVWQDALTQEEVQARMNRTIDLASSTADGLVASYRFDFGSGTTAYDVANRHDGTLQGDPQWTNPSGASVGRTSAVLTDGTTPVTVGPSGSRAEAALSSGTGLSNDATVYRWGTESGAVITDEAFSNGVDDRSNVAWGLWPRESAEAELTLSYGDLSGLPSGETAQLLRRDRPGTAWSDVSEHANVSHDGGSTQFTVVGAESPAQYAVTAVPSVDLQLAADVSTPERSQGTQTTVTFTLENTSSSTAATGVAIDVTVPGGLSMQGTSPSTGSYAGGTWDVGTVGAGAAATLEFTVQKDAAAPQLLSARLGALEQGDPDGAQAAGVLVPPPYGSGQALAFDDGGDYVATGAGGDDLGLANESFSIGAWVRIDDLSGDRTIAGMDGGAANQTLHLVVQSDGSVKFGFFANDLVTSSGEVSSGTWTHLTFVYDAASSERFIYRNGEQVAHETGVPSDLQGTNELLIGRWGSGNFGGGQLDQVRVWQDALTQEQVQARMNRTIDLSSPVADALVASYRFDAGTGSTAYDPASGHNGTLQGTPQWTDPSGASAGRESTVLTEGTTPVSVGPSGSRVQATLSSGTGLANDVAVYRWGTESGALVTDDAFPSRIQDRSNVAWGVWPRGSAETALTLHYGDVQGLATDGSESVQLLRRHPADATWSAATGASGVSHDPAADQFTVSGVTGPGQYAVANGPPPVDLALSASPAMVEVRPNGTATADVTLTLENTDASDAASGVEVDVGLPSGLSIENHSGDGSYSGGTWAVGTVAASSSATITLSVSLSSTQPQTLSAQLGTLDQIDNDGAGASARIAARSYGGGQALAFDGSGDYVNGGSDLRLDNRSFSISFWAKRASTGSNAFVIGQGPNSGSRKSLHVGFRGDDRFTFAFFGDDLDTDATYADTQWHHWTVTYDASTQERRIYRDGLEVAADNTGGDFQGTGDFLIGRRAYTGSGAFDGQIDQVRVWHAALTQEQVQARMNRTIDLSSPTADALVATYRFDAGSGTTAHEVAGGHDGTFQGDPQWTDPSGTPVGRQSGVLVDGATPVTVGPSGSEVMASQTDDGDPSTDATVYRWGDEDGPKVVDGTLSNGRSHVAWGLWPRNGAAADLTLHYGDVQSVSGSQTVYLLRRVRPGEPWLDVSDKTNVSRDAGAETFTVMGADAAAQYVVSNEQPPTVDLALTANPMEVQVSQGGSFTATLSLQNLGNAEATGAEVTVDVPSGLTLDGSSGDGTLSNGTWSVSSIGAGATASLELNLTNDATTPPTLSADLATLNQTDANPDNNATSVSVLAYGSGRALAFDGSDDYVEVSSSGALDGGSHMSFEAWVYLEETSGDQVILERYGEESTLFGGYILAVQNGQLRFKAGTVVTTGISPTWSRPEVVGGTVPANEWTHVAATYQGGTVIKIFVNGREARSTTNLVHDEIDDCCDGTLSIGSTDAGSGEALNGKIDQVRIWETTLSQEQIQARAHRTVSMAGSAADDLVAGYRFNSGNDVVAYDVTGNYDGANRTSSFVASGAAVGRRSAVVTDATTPQTVGPSGSRMEASLTGGTGLTSSATVYRWGREDNALVTKDAFPLNLEDRSHVTWGIWPRGAAEADLTLEYGDVQGLTTDGSEPVQLLRRSSVDATWGTVTEASGVSHDPGADQFTVAGVTSAGQYAVANAPRGVDLTLSATRSKEELRPSGEATTDVTLTLQNASGSSDATGVSIDVAVPSGLSVESSSGDGTYSGGTWDVGTVPAGGSATHTLSVALTSPTGQTLSMQLGALDQIDDDGASADTRIVPLPYGSGQALAFDGSGNYVTTGAGADALGLANESFSIGAWIRVDDLSSSRTVAGMDGSGANETLHLVVQGNGAVKFGFYSNDLETSSGAVQAGEWTHLTFVYDAASSERFIYRNGEPVAHETGVSSDLQGAKELLIGRWGGGNYFSGQMDLVRVWQGGLTQEQVQARMNRTINLSSSVAGDLVAAYRFDTGSGSTAIDPVGGHHGTIQGTPQWTDPSGASMGRQSTVLSDNTTPVTVGPAGSRVEASLTNGSGLANDVTLYRWGTEEGAGVGGEAFPRADIVDRSNVAWGAWPRGSAEADLTISYGDIGSLVTDGTVSVRLLRRDQPGTAWSDATGAGTVSHDSGADQFTITGVTEPAQYAVTNDRPPVDLTLTATGPAAPELAPGAQTTVTFTLENTDGSAEATNVATDVTLPSGLTVQSSSPTAGSYSGGTWTVPTLGAGGTASLGLTVQLDQRSPRILTAQLDAFDQRDPNGASADVTFTPRPYGSGQALALDGAQDGSAAHVRVPDAGALDLTTPFTVEAWIKWDGSDGFRVFLSKPDGSSSSGFSMVVQDGHLRAGGARNDDETLPANEWVHAAVTVTNSGRTLYLNGQNVATGSAGADLNNDQSLLIGREFPPGNFDDRTFPGDIDQVRLWDAALTQSDVQARMNRTMDLSSSAADPLVAAYRFDAGSGSTAYDAAGNHHGSLENTPTWLDPGSVPVGQRSAYAAAGATQSTGPTDAQIGAALGSGVTPVGLYSFGEADGATVSNGEEDFASATVTERLPVVWGVDANGSTTANLTLTYSGMMDGGPSATLRVLRRTAPGQPWEDVSDLFTHDAQAQAFSATGVSSFSQYALGLTTALQIDGTAGADGSDAGWRFLGVPTASELPAGDLRLGGAAPSFNLPSGHMLQRWDDELAGSPTGGYAPIESGTKSLGPGRGYAVYLFDEGAWKIDPSMTIDVAGDPAFMGDQSVTVDDLAPTARWHFLANPYPTGYDLSSLTDLTNNGFQAQVQRYDATTGSWVVESQSSTELSHWQAFFIERTTPGSADPGATSLTFDPTGRIATAPFVGSKAEESGPSVRRARLALGLDVTSAEGDTLSTDAAAQVLFDERATGGWDPWDASKLTPLSSRHALLAPVGTGRDSAQVQKAVESRPWPSARQEIPLRLTSTGLEEVQEATLSVQEWALPDGWRARIVDTETGEPQRLGIRGTATVTLPADTASGGGRYELQVAPEGAPLPVELVAFEAAEDGEDVRLTWQTATETNNAGFRVLRRAKESGEERTWTQLGFVEGQGTSEDPQTYRFTDADPPFAADTLSYRLRQVDTDGTTRPSEILTVARHAVQEVRLHGSFPNPAQSQAKIRYALPQPTEVRLELYDVLGRRVVTLVRGEQEAGRKQIQLNASRLASGTYFYRLEVGETTTTRKLTIVR